MARVKRSVNAKKKRRTVLEQASGYRGQRSRMYRKAKEQVTHSFVYSYRDRKAKKGDYNRLIQGLNLAGVEVDRRMLAELAVNDINAFNALVKVAKDALPADINAPKA